VLYLKLDLGHHQSAHRSELKAFTCYEIIPKVAVRRVGFVVLIWSGRPSSPCTNGTTLLGPQSKDKIKLRSVSRYIGVFQDESCHQFKMELPRGYHLYVERVTLLIQISCLFLRGRLLRPGGHRQICPKSRVCLPQRQIGIRKGMTEAASKSRQSRSNHISGKPRSAQSGAPATPTGFILVY